MDFNEFQLQKTGDGLLPVIIQDACTLKVLMLGYMNKEAYDRTVAEGLVTFWSRGRKCLWTKGETSGNYLHVVEMYPDCDSDTLLVKVHPDGPVCHRGTVACFDTPAEEGFVKQLVALIKDRHKALPEGSYTTGLFIRGVKQICKKVGEECTESIIEAVDGKRDRFIYEAADLLYHYLVLIEALDVDPDDIEKELYLRHH